MNYTNLYTGNDIMVVDNVDNFFKLVYIYKNGDEIMLINKRVFIAEFIRRQIDLRHM